MSLGSRVSRSLSRWSAARVLLDNRRMRGRIVLLGWIAAGLLSACGPEEKFEAWTLADLSPAEGWGIRIPQFDLQIGEESQNCYFLEAPDLNNGEDYFVSRVHMGVNPGSHHMNVFRVNSIIGLDPALGTPVQIGEYEGTLIEGHDEFFTNPCWDSGNWADWPLLANSQNSDLDNPYTDWTLPENVAIRMTPGEPLMIQTHYVNYGPQTTPYGGRVGINFHRRQEPGTPVELGSLFATQQSIRICQSNPNPTFSGTCRFPNGDVTVEAVNGHFHSRGKKFTVYTWDGLSIDQPPEANHIYTSNAWDDPPMALGIDRHVPSGGGVWWNCEYNWIPPAAESCDEVNEKDPSKQGDCCYTFGGNVDVGEHCNVFLYYYPRVDNNDVFCN